MISHPRLGGSAPGSPFDTKARAARDAVAGVAPISSDNSLTRIPSFSAMYKNAKISETLICGAFCRSKARQASRLFRRRPGPSVIRVGRDNQSRRARPGTGPRLAPPKFQPRALVRRLDRCKRCLDRGLLLLRLDIVARLKIYRDGRAIAQRFAGQTCSASQWVIDQGRAHLNLRTGADAAPPAMLALLGVRGKRSRCTSTLRCQRPPKPLMAGSRPVVLAIPQPDAEPRISAAQKRRRTRRSAAPVSLAVSGPRSWR